MFGKGYSERFGNFFGQWQRKMKRKIEEEGVVAGYMSRGRSLGLRNI